ncbi:NAD(P)-dependent oxidoreductase [Campylobacter volucris]|uniref:NAD(P)-dependent oxidoreductase n=1 Tax=Campylobacter volucris TaxID=1031542 RepID=A0AAE5YJC0_9BACT|nr:NAD(P)-dependent oxidoreductase [Campylobacter volucris]AJC93648.1 nucleoside-diphosphate-sugar epimerase [Campylobacter volucris LMG 24379]KAB0579871.1 NAD(P)-dependent oxidoreductase [Campylobacter volucris]QBL13968.1 nucleoside-diphosphate sugar epimerase [Campylobacter volucris]QEL07861.1 nucleoside-diphosphate-sugar epimerase [Campylobacter volucris]TXK70795.1 NAD(P)-dependent oxidoreductase [Campylobacter volucris]
MKKVIISGAAGFIGSRLVRLLLKNNVEVLALGKKDRKNVNPLRLPEDPKLTYLKLDMAEISNLPQILKSIGWDPIGSVFYHFAWGGKNGLSDLIVEDQYENVTWTINAFIVADKMKCSKFIHVGTMEEAFATPYLELDYHKEKHYNRHVVYALAKKATRDYLKAISSQFNINLIIATNSHVVGPNDSRDSFLLVVVQKIINDEKIEMTSGEQTFDSISVTDCAKAFKVIGEKGSKNSEYWIGSGNPRKLKEYVEIIASLYPPKYAIEFGKISYSDVKLEEQIFSSETLNKELAFKCTQSFESAIDEVYKWLKFKEMFEE